MAKKQQISVQIPEEKLKEWRDYAEEMGITISGLVRIAVEKYIRKELKELKVE